MMRPLAFVKIFVVQPSCASRWDTNTQVQAVWITAAYYVLTICMLHISLLRCVPMHMLGQTHSAAEWGPQLLCATHQISWAFQLWCVRLLMMEIVAEYYGASSAAVADRTVNWALVVHIAVQNEVLGLWPYFYSVVALLFRVRMICHILNCDSLLSTPAECCCWLSVVYPSCRSYGVPGNKPYRLVSTITARLVLDLWPKFGCHLAQKKWFA